ncbi:MAG TPA: DUF420 domain-containing protein [Chthoniobacterales bacterium]
MDVYDLPVVNASLNALSTVLIALGWFFIRRDLKKQHIACMVAALVTSTAFLVCYLWYHYHAGSIRFTAPGIVRPIYFVILITHTVLAGFVPVLVTLTVIPALRARFDRHRRLGRWTMPVWLYVSITGVIVYLMLYQWYPPQEVLDRRAQKVVQQ